VRNVGTKAHLKSSQIKKLGFNQSQIDIYKFELQKHKLQWPYEIDSGKVLKNKPRGFEKFIQDMVACGLEKDVPSYRAALPVDWSAELKKFDSMKTYDEFWNHLISLHLNPALSGSYEKQIKHHGLGRWIKIINSLDYPERFESEIERRSGAFVAISSLSKFLPTVATEKAEVENPLFFLQYTSSADNFIQNLNQVRTLEQINPLDKLRMMRLLDLQVFEPWKNQLIDKFHSIPKPTPDQEISHRAAIREINSLESRYEQETVAMYEERVAFLLKDKTVVELKKFAETHAPEAKTTGAKGKVIHSILTELELENTLIGRYLSD
jgi:hypothetical protein